MGEVAQAFNVGVKVTSTQNPTEVKFCERFRLAKAFVLRSTISFKICSVTGIHEWLPTHIHVTFYVT